MICCTHPGGFPIQYCIKKLGKAQTQREWQECRELLWGAARWIECMQGCTCACVVVVLDVLDVTRLYKTREVQKDLSALHACRQEGERVCWCQWC